jgi:hypothetical protein
LQLLGLHHRVDAHPPHAIEPERDEVLQHGRGLPAPGLGKDADRADLPGFRHLDHVGEHLDVPG